VFVVHGDAVLRERLCELIASEGLRAVPLGSAIEFALSARANLPACVILDTGLADMDRLELQECIVHADVSFVFLTHRLDLSCSVRAIKHGAINFLTLPLREEDLLHAVHTGIQHGRRARETRARFTQIQKRWSRLSRSERELLPFIMKGFLNKQVAFELGTSVRNIQTQRSRIMHKMGAGSSSELVRMMDALNVPPAR
jgi:FixJ family two-component response regulator